MVETVKLALPSKTVADSQHEEEVVDQTSSRRAGTDQGSLAATSAWSLYDWSHMKRPPVNAAKLDSRTWLTGSTDEAGVVRTLRELAAQLPDVTKHDFETACLLVYYDQGAEALARSREFLAARQRDHATVAAAQRQAAWTRVSGFVAIATILISLYALGEAGEQRRNQQRLEEEVRAIQKFVASTAVLLEELELDFQHRHTTAWVPPEETPEEKKPDKPPGR